LWQEVKGEKANFLAFSCAVSTKNNASTAGYRVGYNDPAHFTRDYKKLFGRPPRQDVRLHARSVSAV